MALTESHYSMHLALALAADSRNDEPRIYIFGMVLESLPHYQHIYRFTECISPPKALSSCFMEAMREIVHFQWNHTAFH